MTVASTTSPAPVRFVFAITSWGTALRKCRVDPRIDLSYKEMADRVGVQKAVIKAWENGEGYPTPQQLKRIYASCSLLRRYENLLPDSAAEEVRRARDVDPEEQRRAAAAEREPTPPPHAIDEPRTFPEALGKARRLEGLRQDELGELIAVTQSVISSWERGDSTPIQAHYEKLVDLLPVLAGAPRPPGIRDIPKPAGSFVGADIGGGRPDPREYGKGVVVEVDMEPSDATAAVAYAMAPVVTVDEAGVAYARALAEVTRLRREEEAALRRAVDLKLACQDAEEAARAALLALTNLTGYVPGSK